MSVFENYLPTTVHGGGHHNHKAPSGLALASLPICLDAAAERLAKMYAKEQMKQHFAQSTEFLRRMGIHALGKADLDYLEFYDGLVDLRGYEPERQHEDEFTLALTRASELFDEVIVCHACYGAVDEYAMFGVLRGDHRDALYIVARWNTGAKSLIASSCITQAATYAKREHTTLKVLNRIRFPFYFVVMGLLIATPLGMGLLQSIHNFTNAHFRFDALVGLAGIVIVFELGLFACYSIAAVLVRRRLSRLLRGEEDVGAECQLSH